MLIGFLGQVRSFSVKIRHLFGGRVDVPAWGYACRRGKASYLPQQGRARLAAEAFDVILKRSRQVNVVAVVNPGYIANRIGKKAESWRRFCDWTRIQQNCLDVGRTLANRGAIDQCRTRLARIDVAKLGGEAQGK